MESLGRRTSRWYLLGGVGLAAIIGLGIWTARNQFTTMSPRVLTGRVLSPGGRAVAGARVYFVRGPVALPDVALLTDPSGAFALAVPVPGTYQLGCAAAGFATATATVEVVAEQPAPVEIRLRSGGPE